jgi:hypothetical protein
VKTRHLPAFVMIPLAAALALILASCAQVEVESEFDSDGSARHSISTTVERAFLDGDMLGDELGGEIDFDEIEREAEAAGLDAERIDTTERVGVRLSTNVEDNEDLGNVMDELFSAATGDAGGMAGFEGGFTESSGIGGGSYRFELTIDGDALFDGEFTDMDAELDSEVEDEFGMEFDAGMLQQLFDFTYTVTMPGEITEHNGNELGSSTVQWELPLQGRETFVAESADGSSFPVALIAGVAIGIIALILIVLGAMTLMRGQKAPTGPAPGTRPDSAEPGS